MGLLLTACPQRLSNDFDVASMLADSNVGGEGGSGEVNFGGSGRSGCSEGAGNSGGAGAAGNVPRSDAGGGSVGEADAAGVDASRVDSGARGEVDSGVTGVDADVLITDSGVVEPVLPDSGLPPPPVCTVEQRADPEFCGCGVEANTDCRDLRNALAVRYSFGGSGIVVDDRVGLLDAEVINGSLAAAGELPLSGTTFLSVPDDLASNLANATFELWLTWNGGAAPQKIFNFGNRDAAAEQHYFSLTPQQAGANGVLQVVFTASGQPSEVSFLATRALPISVQSHVAVVVNGAASAMAIYINGVQESSGLFNGSLAALKDTTNWVGRSHFDSEPFLDAILHEFRIYDVALSTSAIAKSAELGPNAEFLVP